MQRSAASGDVGRRGRPRFAAVGPRGGTTTVSKSGQVKKNLWVPGDQAEALRLKAFRERRTEADILREGLRLVLGLEEASG